MDCKELKAEAVYRLKNYFNLSCLDDFKPISRFEKDGTIFFQERQSQFADGLLWECNGYTCNGVVDKAIVNFQKKFPTQFVYYALLNYTEFGTCVSIFYVSDNKDEWEMDREDLKAGMPFVYVYNVDDENCSEFGSIQVKKAFIGGIKRVG